MSCKECHVSRHLNYDIISSGEPALDNFHIRINNSFQQRTSIQRKRKHEPNDLRLTSDLEVLLTRLSLRLLSLSIHTSLKATD